MEKGIIVTKENMMVIFGHLKKVVEKKQFLTGRSFFTRSLKEVNKIVPRLKDSRGIFDGPKCLVSRLMHGNSGIVFDGSRIWLNPKLDYGYFYIQQGNRVFITPTGIIYIERVDFQIGRPKNKFIVRIS